MRAILTLTLTDLRQRIRDRSVLIFAIVVPLALMYVFNLVFGATEELDLQPVAVTLTAPADDEMAEVVVEVLRGLDGDGVEVMLEEVQDAGIARARAEDGDTDLALLLPRGFGTAVQAGEAVQVDAVRGEEAGIETDIVLSVVDGVLEEFAAAAVTARAGVASGVPPEEVGEVAERVLAAAPAYTVAQGEAADEQLGPGAALVAGQAGLFLLFTVSFGVTGLLTERETGTLARLRSTPMPAWYVVLAKALVSFVLGAAATTVLLTVGGWLFDAEFGALLPVAALVLAVSLAATSVMFLIVRIAATSEQASVATSIVAVVLGIGGGAFMPVSAAGPWSVLLDLNPVAALLRGLGITSAGGGISDLGVPLGIMLGFAVVMFVVSRVVPDRGALS